MGSSIESVKHTLYSLTHLITQVTVKTINHHEIIQGAWAEHAYILIIPGGADCGYCRLLNGQGNAVNRQYVEQGGSYLGLCAEAYSGARNVEFSCNTNIEVIEVRELSFTNVTAVRPTLAPYDYHSDAGGRAAKLVWLETIHTDEFVSRNGSRFTAFFNGGCHFDLPHHHHSADQSNPNNNILAGYDEPQLNHNHAVIIEAKVDRGLVILSGVHMEYAPELMNIGGGYAGAIIKKLIRHDGRRKIYFNFILTRLLRLQCD